jgi:Domain of unknown function (DUF5658)
MSSAGLRSRICVCVVVGMLLWSTGHMAAQEQIAPPPSSLQISDALLEDGIVSPAPSRPDTPPPRATLALYSSFGVLQALDVHSTHRALGRGGREANPIMGTMAGSPMLMAGVKAGATVGIIYLSEKLRKRNRTAAMVVMVALNSTYAVVVSRNYAIGR